MENQIEKKVTIVCPACGEYAHSFFSKKNGFLLYACDSCRMLRLNPIPQAIEKVYEKDYFAGAEKGHGYVNYDADKEPMRPTFNTYLDLVERYQIQKGLLLDIGAATGFFADIARSRGWQAEGIEISDFAAEEGRKKGLTIMTGTLQTVRPAKMYRAITMWDVLEHMTDPEKEIAEAYRILEKGGTIAFSTPDSGSMYAKIMGSKWHLIVPPEHIYYFNGKSIAVFLEKHGFETKLITRIGKQFTLEYIFKTLAAWQGIGIWKWLTRFLERHPKIGRISLPINLRDNMFVIAVKK